MRWFLHRLNLRWCRKRRQQSSGRHLIRAGMQCQQSGALQEGILFLVRGLELLDIEKQPADALSGYHTLAYFFSELQLPIITQAILERARPLYQRIGDSQLAAQRLWLEGRTASQRGEHSRALTLHEEAITALTALGLTADAQRVRADRRSTEQRLRLSVRET